MSTGTVHKGDGSADGGDRNGGAGREGGGTGGEGGDAVRPGRGASDVVGMALLGACAAWALITATAHGGRPEGVLLALLAVAAGHASGRICGALLPVAAPCAAALTGTVLTITFPGLTPGPHVALPLGHTGATAALLALSAGSACCAAWAARAPFTRVLLGLLAVGIAVTAGVLGSVAGAVACTGVLLCSLAAGQVRRRAAGLTLPAVVTVLVTGVCWALARGVLPDGPAGVLEGRLTTYRTQLWQEALTLVDRYPALGAGPGRFGEVSNTSATAVFTDGKPHSALLQQGAEQGVVGVVLLVAAFCWVLHALWRSPRPTPVVLSASAALCALAVISAVGNALSFTVVTVGAGWLAGLATARPLDGEVR